MLIKLTSLTRYVYYFLIALILIGLGANLMFLYNDFYKTLTQAQVIYLLRNQVIFEMVDMKLWNKVSAAFQFKQRPLVIEKEAFKDPFK